MKQALDDAVRLHQVGDKAAARTALDRALAIRPGHPDALHMLANLDGEAGDYASAEKRVAQALRERPGFPDYLSTLAKIQAATGRADAAMTSLESALKKAPTSKRFNDLGLLFLGDQKPAEAAQMFARALDYDAANQIALVNLGVACFANGDARAAASHLESALAMRPGDSGVAQRLGKVWQACGEHDRAVRVLGMAQQSAPQSAALETSIGISLTALGRFDEARKKFDAALAIDSGYADALAGKAELLDWQGEYAQGLRILEPAVKEGNCEPAVLIVYARLLRRGGQAERGAQLLRPLEASGRLGGIQLRQLRFTLGDLCDELEQYDEAFDWYRLAHEYRPNEFSMPAHLTFISELQERFSAENLTRLDRADSDTQQPVFIVGMPRSGTSLVEQILAAHPRVFAAGERPDLGRIVKTIASQQSPSVAQLTQHAQAYMNASGEVQDDCLRITDKMPLNFLYLGWAAQLFPGARIVWCRRDPRDTGLSCYATNFIDPALAFCDDLGNIGRYSNSCDTLMEHWKKVLGLPIIELQYENLVREPEARVRELLGALELDWNPDCLAFHKVNRVVKTSSHAQVREPFYTRAVGRWSHYEAHLKPLLEALGHDD